MLGHHENKGGSVSGAWEGVGETLWHVQAQGHGHTRLFLQKLRWADEWHGRSLHLSSASGQSFTVDEKPTLDDDAIADLLLEAIRENPGAPWTQIAKAVKGVRDERRRDVRDRLFAEGLIVNVVRRDGAEVAIAECPERRPSRLYLADDPVIVHLRPDPDAAGPQMPLPGVGSDSAHLRPASPPYRDAGRRDADERPQDASDAEPEAGIYDW
jgi:hypothetical protein